MEPTEVAIKLAEASQSRESMMLVLLGIMTTVWIIRQIVPLIQWFKGEKKLVDIDDEAARREATRILLTKDLDGQYVFLGLPRLLREFNSTLGAFTEQMRHLVNHQSETLKHLDTTAQATQRLVLKINQKAEEILENSK